jgi:predicted PurR-regulated permease PerM
MTRRAHAGKQILRWIALHILVGGALRSRCSGLSASLVALTRGEAAFALCDARRGRATRYGDGVSALQSGPRDYARFLPPVLRVSAAVCWRLLVVAAALYVLGQVVTRLYIVVIPVAIALLLAALLAPAVTLLTSVRVPRALATALVVIGGLAAVGGILTFVIEQFINGFPQLLTNLTASLNQARDWLISGPPHLRPEQINTYLRQAQQFLESNQAALTTGALSTATTFSDFLSGLVLMLFTLIFFLHDGRGIWTFVLRIVPLELRQRVDVAGCQGFASLSAFVRGTAVIAVADALGIYLGLLIIGVPLAAPLSALVFLGAFVPIFGSVVSGSVAILVALVAKGWIAALLVLVVLLAVMQIEGNVLQPLVLGRAVELHPLAIVLAITAGLVMSGISGALLAVPLIAVLHSAIASLMESEPAAAGPPDSDQTQPPPNGEDASEPALS